MKNNSKNKKIEDKKNINKFLNLFIHLVGYTLVLILVSLIFKNTIDIDTPLWIWGFLVILIIYAANKLVKPLLFWLTLPITALTLGLFYPVLNVLILKIADWLLFDHFDINGFWMPFVVSIVISIMNAIMDNIIIDTFLRRFKK